MANVGVEPVAVDGPVQNHPRDHAAQPKARDHRGGLAVYLGEAHSQPGAARTPPVAAGSIGGGPCLVEEDQPLRVEIGLRVEPSAMRPAIRRRLPASLARRSEMRSPRPRTGGPRLANRRARRRFAGRASTIAAFTRQGAASRSQPRPARPEAPPLRWSGGARGLRSASRAQASGTACRQSRVPGRRR